MLVASHSRPSYRMSAVLWWWLPLVWLLLIECQWWYSVCCFLYEGPQIPISTNKSINTTHMCACTHTAYAASFCFSTLNTVSSTTAGKVWAIVMLCFSIVMEKWVTVMLCFIILMEEKRVCAMLWSSILMEESDWLWCSVSVSWWRKVTDCDALFQYPDGESSSPYVFICENPQELIIKFPIKGKHKICKLCLLLLNHWMTDSNAHTIYSRIMHAHSAGIGEKEAYIFTHARLKKHDEFTVHTHTPEERKYRQMRSRIMSYDARSVLRVDQKADIHMHFYCCRLLSQSPLQMQVNFFTSAAGNGSEVTVLAKS